MSSLVRFWEVFVCIFSHNERKVITAYSNRTHRWKCQECGREWDD